MTEPAATDPGAFVMPFGVHRDKPLARVPRGYLHWLLDNATNLHADTREAIEAFLKQPKPPEPQGELPGTKPRRTRGASAPRSGAASVTCHRCQLPGSAARPLVHADCATDDVPF